MMNRKDCSSSGVPNPKLSRLILTDLYEKSETIPNADGPSEAEIHKKKVINLYFYQDFSNFETTLFCDICLKEFNTASSLLRHKCTHFSEEDFQHGIYQERFSHIEHLSQCNRTDSENESGQSNVFEQTFLQSGRDRQMRTYTAKKTVQCDVCKKKFLYTYHLNRHMLIHTGEMPFQCDLCKREFSRKDNFNVHMRLHTPEKSFQCDACLKTFSKKVHLNRHMQTHTGQKLFQ
ncbi:hypothetical protein TNIN_81621 [Trichonephila inaurata madagascariensis]|uniref:C2H2-type domain-containing protein n=1 Tax=Trichonephila inaurata madagascariensis TaxID=2747483 RepID=A0A8X6I641_9ARAC|nr:hypothetical protein TNIN_81621 [Trichonephila inaurata madagascariensis]